MAAKRSKVSAGLLMFRLRDEQLEVLLVHPGGPYFQNKDAGCWTIPKGEAGEGEDLLTRARVEFEEELGITACADEWLPLGEVNQAGGKLVHAWAFECDLPNNFAVRSNTFELEWPPRSGRRAVFPEVDRAEFFSVAEAQTKINKAQVAFLDRLSTALASRLHQPR